MDKNIIQQKMITMFEQIIEKQLEHIVDTFTNCSLEKPHLLNRDFRNIFISRAEYLRVCQNMGAFGLMYDCGSGYHTNWFLYNSLKRNKLFMIWVHHKNPSVLDLEKEESLGIIKEHDINQQDDLNKLCFQQYMNSINVMGGFRDDIYRITQV